MRRACLRMWCRNWPSGPGRRAPSSPRQSPPPLPPPSLCSSRRDRGATRQLSGIWLGLWASAFGGAAQSASMFINVDLDPSACLSDLEPSACLSTTTGCCITKSATAVGDNEKAMAMGFILLAESDLADWFLTPDKRLQVETEGGSVLHTARGYLAHPPASVCYGGKIP